MPTLPTRLLLSAVVLAFFLVALPTSHAQEDNPERVYTIALYAPDIMFGDSVAKASFVQRIAAAVSKRTGLTFRGKSFARAGDVGARGSIDYAILGGTHFASNGGGKLIAGAGSAPIALMGRAPSVAALRGKTLILPRSGGMWEGYVTGAVLGHEMKAKDFFGSIKYTKDVSSAITAVKLGQADATVAFAPYAGSAGLKILYQGGQGPLPVIVQVNSSIDSDTAAKIAKGFRGVGASGGGIVKGFGGGSGGVGAFRGAAGGAKLKKRPTMSDGRPVRVRFKPARGAKDAEDFDITPPLGIVPQPALPPEE